MRLPSRIFRKFLVLALPVLFLNLVSLAATAAERIGLFESQITVRTDGTLEVREDITVDILHQEIRHGIYRDFPTSYKDNSGHTYRVGFDVGGVLLDGSPIPYKVSGQGNGVRIRIGDPDKMAPRGPHTYTIWYETTGQLGFFEDHDELYWNVTGNGWAFPIDKAVAKVFLPEGVDARKLAWYTGPSGSRAKNAKGATDGNLAAVMTTRPLGAEEGLTIAVAFDKGHVSPSPEQSAREKRAELTGRYGTALPPLALLIVLTYFILVWFRYGRDGGDRVIPLFDPPDRLLPADGTYLQYQGYRDQAMTATVLDLAIRGFLTVEEIPAFSVFSFGTSQTSKPGGYRLIRKSHRGDLNPREAAFLGDLFSGGDTIDLKEPGPLHREALQRAQRGLKSTVREICRGLVKKNYGWSIMGLTLTLLLLGGSGFIIAWGQGVIPMFLFSALWLTIWTTGVASLVMAAFTTLRDGTRRKEWKKILKGIFLVLFSLPFLAGEVFGLFMTAAGTTLTFSASMMVALVVNVLFFRIMKGYSPAGRMMMDRVQGFRMYLETAERERIRALASTSMPEDTPERFERLLPWALALGVEKQWASRFEEVLLKNDYQPDWYHGTGPWHMAGPSMIASGLSSGLGQAISSAATPPGSSSGFGGGGSSGGGGGGGGGGGW